MFLFDEWSCPHAYGHVCTMMFVPLACVYARWRGTKLVLNYLCLVTPALTPLEWAGCG